MDQTAILVDGADNSARTVQGPMITQAQFLKPAVEAVSEFKVITNNISAEYGYKAGAQVLVSTKSGTIELHGTLYEFHRNNATAANNFMFNRDGPRDPQTGQLTDTRPPFIRNQFGGTRGGPIARDKTFFFFSFQGTQIRQGGNSFRQSVPSALARKGDFSRELQIGADGPQIYDPATLTGTGAAAERQPFPNHLIPPERIDPEARKMIELYPLPNVPGSGIPSPQLTSGSSATGMTTKDTIPASTTTSTTITASSAATPTAPRTAPRGPKCPFPPPPPTSSSTGAIRSPSTTMPP